jgi:hypothetical protein
MVLKPSEKRKTNVQHTAQRNSGILQTQQCTKPEVLCTGVLRDSDSIFETGYKNYRIVTLKYKALTKNGKKLDK